MPVEKTRVPAVDGWFTLDDEPALLGTRCAACGTFVFPSGTAFCRNPHCGSTDLVEVPLSRRGVVWSYTTNHYEAPPPYRAPDPFVPYTVAAVELAEERMVVLGQVVARDAGAIAVGDEVELVLDTLFEDETNEYLVWKWRRTEDPR